MSLVLNIQQKTTCSWNLGLDRKKTQKDVPAGRHGWIWMQSQNPVTSHCIADTTLSPPKQQRDTDRNLWLTSTGLQHACWPQLLPNYTLAVGARVHFFSLLFSDHSQKCKNSWCVNLTDFLHHVVTFVWHKEKIFWPVLLGAHCTLEISQGITSGKMFFWRKDKGSSTSLINCNSPWVWTA